MGRHFRIRVRGKPRKHLDPDLLAQVVILYGRQLARQQQADQDHDTSAGDQSNRDSSISDDLADVSGVDNDPKPRQAP
jgi:hypothetical protein